MRLWDEQVATAYRESFDELVSVEVGDQGLAYPSAASLVRLAHARALREDWVQASELEPLYLRKPDAEVNWTTRDSGNREPA